MGLLGNREIWLPGETDMWLPGRYRVSRKRNVVAMEREMGMQVIQ